MGREDNPEQWGISGRTGRDHSRSGLCIDGLNEEQHMM